MTETEPQPQTTDKCSISSAEIGLSVGVGVAIALLACANEYANLSPIGGETYFPVYTCVKVLLIVAVPLCAVIGIPIWFVSKDQPARRKRIIKIAIALAIGCGLGFLGKSPVRQMCLHSLIARSQPLIAAITKYEAENGKPPADLQALVPKYISAVPDTQCGSGQQYEFEHWEGREKLRPEPDVHWELKVVCPVHPSNWDCIFYWPTKKYPKEIYSGDTEPIDDWAYVHE